jgi:hypothetical protein
MAMVMVSSALQTSDNSFVGEQDALKHAKDKIANISLK